MALLVALAARAVEPAGGSAPLTNSVGMTLVLAPAGSFTMGSPPGTPLRQEEETTRQVALSKPFRMSATEVTRGQFAAVMGQNAVPQGEADLPAVAVSWRDAQAFCQKLSQKEGARYRLPSEAEWEYACRAGGDGATDIDSTAWHAGTSDETAHPVARKQPNAWGLHDMLGNVAEWTQDVYAPYPRVERETDPTGPAKGTTRVVRGGAFRSFPPAVRCAARASASEPYQLAHVGFRVVQEIE
jgi:formylglycine-generating enzyme required for sulfatase activity